MSKVSFKCVLLSFFLLSTQLLISDTKMDLIVEEYNEKVDKLADVFKTKKSKCKKDTIKKLEALKKQNMQKGDLDSANTIQKKLKQLKGESTEALNEADNSPYEFVFDNVPPPPGTSPVSKKDIRRFRRVNSPTELHKALKTLNPAYQENGKIEVEDGQIVEVKLTNCNIVNIAPLAGLKYLRNVEIGNNLIWDISPLKNLKLSGLSINRTDVRDLNVIKGMKLIWLDISYTKIDDISLLKKMPLEYLSMAGCIFIKDISPIEKSKDLKELILPAQALDMDISFLKKFKHLEFIDDKWQENKKSTKQFWKELRAR